MMTLCLHRRRLPFLPLGGITLFLISSSFTHGELRLASDPLPQSVFAGSNRLIHLMLSNSDAHTVTRDIRMKVFQTTSATAVPVDTTFWKTIQILPGQTITETATLNFPFVKSKTPFVIQWLEGTGRLFGVTEVLVYPTNLLGEMNPLASGDSLGVYDPQHQLTPLLNDANVAFVDLENIVLDHFRGRLAIVGQSASATAMPKEQLKQIRTLAREGVAVIWIQPTREHHDKLSPSFYTVTEEKGAVVVVQPATLSNLADDPRSQLNLIHLCRLALHPSAPGLPNLTSNPP